MVEAILFSARRQGAGICRYFQTCRRSNGQNRSNPEGTPKWLRSWARAALRVAMLPEADTRTQYLRHFEASSVPLLSPDTRPFPQFGSSAESRVGTDGVGPCKFRGEA